MFFEEYPNFDDKAITFEDGKIKGWFYANKLIIAEIPYYEPMEIEIEDIDSWIDVLKEYKKFISNKEDK